MLPLKTLKLPPSISPLASHIPDAPPWLPTMLYWKPPHHHPRSVPCLQPFSTESTSTTKATARASPSSLPTALAATPPSGPARSPPSRKIPVHRLGPPRPRPIGQPAQPGPVWKRQLRLRPPSLLDHLGIRRAYVGGLSMGGGISTRFALIFPQRIAALIVIDSASASGLPTPPAAPANATPHR